MRYGSVTDASAPDAIRLAVDRFGAAGIGLRIVERGMLQVRLEGPLGHVAVEASRSSDGRTDLTIETREFDREVQEFISALPRYSRLRLAIRRRRG